MGPVVVSVVVVGACIAVVTWLAVAGGGSRSSEPATATPPSGRAERTRATATPPLVRLRSAAALGCLSVALGVAAALGVGILLVVLVTLLRASVG